MRRTLSIVALFAVTLLAGGTDPAAADLSGLVRWNGAAPLPTAPPSRPAAAALPAPSRDAAQALDPGSRARPLRAAARGFRFVPLGLQLSGTATLTGSVFDTWGAPSVGATVEWGVETDGGQTWGSTKTGADGSYTLNAGLPPASGNGQLWAGPADGLSLLGRTGASWPDAHTTTFDFRPEPAGVQLNASEPWSDWARASVWLYGADGLSGLGAAQSVAKAGWYTSSSVPTLPGLYDAAAVYFWLNEGLELDVDLRTTPKVLDLTFLDAQHGWGVGADGAIVATTDGGTTWSRQPSPTTVDLGSVSFCDALHGWALGPGYDSGGSQVLLATTDGGATWQAQDTGVSDVLTEVTAVDPLHAWAVGFRRLGGNVTIGLVLATADGGATWTERYVTPLPEPTPWYDETRLYDVAFADAQHGWAVGDRSGEGFSMRGVVFATSDGGTTWAPQDTGTALSFYAVDAPDTQHVCAVGYDGIWGTSDGGASWASWGGSTGTPRAVDFTDWAHGWVVGDYGSVMVTSDGGASWTSHSQWPGEIRAYTDVAFTDTTHGWVVPDRGSAGGGPIDSGDGGATWRPTSFIAEQSAAQRLMFTSPYWDSGKPGTTVKMRLQNYPAGWPLRFVGYPAYPRDAAVRSFGTATSTGVYNQAKTVTVPRTAKPGYAYWFGVQHEDGALYLENSFQVCTLNATKTTVTKGTAIRATGTVPVQDHWGGRPGKRTRVYLWAHVGTRGVPTKWDPRSQGWQYVGSVRTDAYGKYRTPLFEPLRTLTLVMQYPGDDWYYGAYTSVRKITVK